MSSKARIWQGLGALLVGAAVFAAAPAAMAAPSDTTPPTAPTNLHAVSITDHDIVLAWNASTDSGGVVNYFLFFDGNETPFIVGAHTQFDVEQNVVIGMIPGSTHTFQVEAQDQSGNSSFSSELTVAFAPGDDTPPTAPTNLHVVSNTADGVQLAWDPSMDESDLAYFVDGTPCGPLQVGNQTQALVPSIDRDPVCGLLPGFTFTFSVRARDAIGFDSDSSNSVTINFAPSSRISDAPDR